MRLIRSLSTDFNIPFECEECWMGMEIFGKQGGREHPIDGKMKSAKWLSGNGD